ncbi:hypothetical protein SAMN05421766_10830 [Zobellia uliginosa]|uniref:Outer membrane protein beta-barrel domain-containing protein n=1 Tax=Zobellia uliginosa TaxID=143224 RepID=A0ABY1L2Z3_9FLAO|nr:hypothetical protein [Zobellia uliginosa]SIT05370.1 hypothetical protein SAMN05421766_10830 [Zobellia uliginosa]
MKKTFLFFTLFALAFSAQCQDGTVEKSTYGIQTGILGLWFHNESKLSDHIALRSEVGLDAGFFGGSVFYDDGTGYLLIPSISVEPRWYYNLKKRASKAKNTADNAGNFVSLKTSFLPDWFVISNYENINVINQLTIIPTWGIRRNIGNHLNYETGIGIGYRYSFAKNAGFSENEGDVAANLHLRIGYRF